MSLIQGSYNLERKLISAQVIEEMLQWLGYVILLFKPHLKQEGDLDLQIHLDGWKTEIRIKQFFFGGMII